MNISIDAMELLRMGEEARNIFLREGKSESFKSLRQRIAERMGMEYKPETDEATWATIR